MKCPDCNGKGEYSFPEAAAIPICDGWFLCQKCNGTGEVEEDNCLTKEVQDG